MKQFVFYKIVSFLTLAVLFTACEKDYYQPKEGEKKSISDIFGEDFVIPEDFDWLTTQSSTVTVKVDDQFDGKYFYVIEIYDANPLFNTNAKLLTKGVAKKGQDYSTSLVYPKSAERIAIKQISPTSKVSIKEFYPEREDGQIYVDFSSINSITTKSGFAIDFPVNENTLRSADSNSDDAIVIPDISEMKDITQGYNQNNGGGNWYIPEGKTYTSSVSFDQNKNFKLFVLGTWKLNSELYIPGNHDNEIIVKGRLEVNKISSRDKAIIRVAETGELKANSISLGNDNSIQVNGTLTVTEDLSLSDRNNKYGEIVIGKNGKLTAKNLTLGNNNSITNYGSIIINEKIKLNNANNKQGKIFIDQGSVFSAKVLETGTDYQFENNGRFSISEGTFGDRTQVINSCSFLVENSLGLANDNTFTIGSESKIKIKNLSAANRATFNIEDKAILEAESIELSVNAKFLGPTGSGQGALILSDKISNKNVVNQNEYAQFNNNLYIKVKSRDDNNFHYTLNDGSKFSDEIAIPKTTCNETGYVPESSDNVTPTNPSFPIISEGETMTYLFEDNWPTLGDYDLNDLVIDLQPKYETDANNKITALTLNVKLRAVGATKRLGAAMQLDGITTENISNIERNDDWLSKGTSIYNMSPNGLESGQTYAVIPLFSDGHAIMGVDKPVQINTGMESRPVQEAQITIKFASPVSRESVTISKMNLFAINKGSSKDARNEIHMYGYQPTAKIHSSTGDIGYKSTNGLIWALGIPGGFSYPLEYVNILQSYEQFKAWATSAGANDKDWYKHPTSGKVYDK